jgi:medium-chain acyl-[acyl-carrier-protein] hydrolase
MAPLDKRWLASSMHRPSASLRLFCFPYAGSGAELFANWGNALPQWVEVCPLQLPGRGSRSTEAPFTEFASLVEAAAGTIAATDLPFAFLGHSMGALVAFELARHLRQQCQPEPVHLFVSGAAAPHRSRCARPRSELPTGELLAELRRLNGTPQEVLANDEVMKMLLPVLRADFSICETYRYCEAQPLRSSITAFSGVRDPEASVEETAAWAQQTTGVFTIHVIPGDHFFINSHRSLVQDLLSRELERSCQKRHNEEVPGFCSLEI